MPKIRFLADIVLRDEHEGTPQETRYNKGQLLDVSEASANHWLNRRVAEIVKSAPKLAAKKKIVAKQSTNERVERDK